jgi:phytoene dehydrogenase-like protein
VEGLVLCGAGVFPGIGVPPVAVSGAMAAHGFISPRQQRERLQQMGLLE